MRIEHPPAGEPANRIATIVAAERRRCALPGREAQIGVQKLGTEGELIAGKPCHSGRIRKNGGCVLRTRRIAGRRKSNVCSANFVEADATGDGRVRCE